MTKGYMFLYTLLCNGNLVLDTIESRERLDDILLVLYAVSLPHGMHCPPWIADVHASHFHLCQHDIAQRGTSCHLRMVGKCLARHDCHLADGLEHGGRVSVRHIFLVGIDFNHGTAVHHRVVRRVMLLRVIRVKGVRHIG